MVGTWFGEIRSCSCLAVLPDSAWVLLNKIYQPFFTSLYFYNFLVICLETGLCILSRADGFLGPHRTRYRCEGMEEAGRNKSREEGEERTEERKANRDGDKKD